MIASFNCLECLIYEFKLMGICLGVDSIYCSQIKGNFYVQFFNIIFTGFLSESMKTASNLAGLFFSLQRYAETSKSENRFLKIFSVIRARKMVLVILLPSLILSTPKIFEYSFTDESSSNYDSPVLFAINSQADIFGVHFVTVIYFAHYIFNDLVMLMANLYIDILLVIQIKSDLQQKIQFKIANLKIDACDSLSNTTKKKLKDDLKKKNAVENKANVMVILNMLLYIFCRLPELLGMFFFYFINNSKYSNSASETCSYKALCYILLDTTEYIYMLSYLVNIIFYYKFNVNFHRGFRKYFGLRDRLKHRTRKQKFPDQKT